MNDQALYPATELERVMKVQEVRAEIARRGEAGLQSGLRVIHRAGGAKAQTFLGTWSFQVVSL